MAKLLPSMSLPLTVTKTVDVSSSESRSWANVAALSFPPAPRASKELGPESKGAPDVTAAGPARAATRAPSPAGAGPGEDGGTVTVEAESTAAPFAAGTGGATAPRPADPEDSGSAGGRVVAASRPPATRR